jgi:hypothetical protein
VSAVAKSSRPPSCAMTRGMCSSRRQRRCVICRHGFIPDARVGDRQRVCGKAECRKKYDRRRLADWRKRHPGYFIERRAKQRAARNASEPVETPRLAAPLSSLPWAMAQEEFGIMGTDFLGSMGRLLLGHAKTEMRGQVIGVTGGSSKVATDLAKTEIRNQVLETTGESAQVGTLEAKTEIPAVPG